MRKRGVTVALLVAMVLAVGISHLSPGECKAPSRPREFAGSVSCRECHENFYKLWSTSFHGLAMQPYTSDFARTKLTPHTGEIAIDGFAYRAEISGSTGYVVEKGKGPSDSKSTRSSMCWAGRTSTTFSPRSTGGVCRPFLWLTMSKRRSGSTPRPAAFGISRISRSIGRNPSTPSTRHATAATSASSPQTTT